MTVFGGDISVERTRILADSVRQDLASSGFTPNDDKSIWEPTQKLVFLGSVLDFDKGLARIPELRILKLKSSLVSKQPDYSQRSCFRYRANYFYGLCSRQCYQIVYKKLLCSD